MEIFVQGLMLYFPTDPKTRREKNSREGAKPETYNRRGSEPRKAFSGLSQSVIRLGFSWELLLTLPWNKSSLCL